jgi:hypothetical protein
MKLEVSALLQDLPKSELILRALKVFLEQAKSCDAAHTVRLGSRQKRRITLTLSQEVDHRLEAFAAERNCQKTLVITAALVAYLQSQKIDPYSDPTREIWSALRVTPPVVESDSW